MGKRTCKAEGCDAPAFARGMCNPCYKRWRRQQAPDRLCSFTGCGKPHDSRGYCKAHALQLRQGQELQPLRAQRPPRICVIDDCGEIAAARGWCQPHWKRWKKYGDPLGGGPMRSKLPGAPVCQADDCEEPPKAKSGISGQYCSSHLNRLNRYGSPNGRPESRLAPDATERTCTWCGLTKPLSEFGPLAAGQLGCKSRCYPCEAEKDRRHRAASSPEARQRRNSVMRRSQVRVRYGEVGLLAYERIQAGAGCDICGARTKKMAIDHDHETGLVRGVLCKDCNLILGWVKDDVVRLRNMAAYLESAGALAA